jgi:DNA-binding FadR family transcriptional regulator
VSIRWDAVTERIRAMVPWKTEEELSALAERIGVSETTLRESTEGRSRLASLKLIQALVRRGVDAKWMLTGDVDTSLHRRMLDSTSDEAETMIKRIVADASGPGRDEGLHRQH